MRLLAGVAVSLLSLVVTAQNASASCPLAGNCTAETAVAALRSAIATGCDCAESAKPKDYMKCAKQRIKDAVKGGALPRQCKKAIKRCEAKNTCGRAGASVCCQVKGGKMKAKVVTQAPQCDGGRMCPGASHALDACMPDGNCAPTAVTTRPFRDIQTVFQTSCALPSCHSALAREGGLVLESEEVSYQNLVDEPSVHLEAQGMGLMRVKSGQPDASFLVRKLRSLGPGDSMPQGTPQLSENVIQIIENWIARGAHQTSEECAPRPAADNAVTAAHGTDHPLTICDDDPIDVGDYEWKPLPPLEAPTPSEGFQLYVPPKDVEPGTEWEYCYAFRVDWPTVAANIGTTVPQLSIKQQVYRMHAGSHHLLIYAYFGAHPDEWRLGEWFPCSAARCLEPGDCPNDTGFNLIPFGGTQVAGTQYNVTYPEGVGLPPTLLSQETVIIANLHYTNPFQPRQPIYGEAWLNFRLHKPGEFKALIDGVFAINFNDLIVEPFETKTMSAVWQPRSLLFRTNIDAAVFQLFGHMHKRGTMFQIDVVRGGECSGSGRTCGRDDDCRCKPWQGNCQPDQRCVLKPGATAIEDVTIYRTTEWDNAPVTDFPPPYLRVKKDEGLRWTCTHVNGVEGDPNYPPKVCHEGCQSCGWDEATRTCVFTQGMELGVDDAPRTFQEVEPIPLVFGELADDDMCNMFGYMITEADANRLLGR